MISPSADALRLCGRRATGGVVVARIAEALDLFGMAPAIQKITGGLSSGQITRGAVPVVPSQAPPVTLPRGGR